MFPYHTGTIPELENFSRAARSEVLRRCVWSASLWWKTLDILIFAAAIVIYEFVLWIFPGLLGSVLSIACCLGAFIGMIYFRHRAIRIRVIRFMSDHILCHQCAYDCGPTVELDRTNCPECGTEQVASLSR